MPDNLDKLLSIVGPRLGADLPSSAATNLLTIRSTFDLLALLKQRNGFYGFENALHVFPVGQSPSPYDLTTWNSEGLWRTEYGNATQDLLFFAEDVFGGQFALKGDHVYRFDPETGDNEHHSDSLEEWAGRLLEDYNFETGHSLAHDWQLQHGPLQLGYRLVPKLPFVMGGSFVVSNLYECEAAEGMRFRATIAKQIRNITDGTRVRLKVMD